jgi:hypothetical protein
LANVNSGEEIRGLGVRGMERKLIKTHRDMEVYKTSFDIAMQIFENSKSFPIEEHYSLADQMRRSSRSVYANLGEA